MRLPTPVSNGAAPDSRIWYRLTFDLPSLPTGTWAICVRRAEDNVAFFVDREPIATSSRAASQEASWNYPQYFELPAERLHVGRNIIYARVYPSSVGEHQLSAVNIGPDSELVPMFRNRIVVQVIGPLAVSAVTGVMGVFMLALWIRWPEDTAFGWLSLACAFMILHFARFFVPDFPVSTYLRAVGDGSFGWMVLALLLFVFRMVGRRHRSVEMLVAGYALAGTILLFATVDRAVFVAIRDGYTVGLFPVEIGVLIYQCMVAWRTRAPMMIALALAATATVGLGVHDLYVRNIASLPDASAYLMPYCPLPLSLAAGGAVIERMVKSHRALEVLNIELESRVTAREAELARTYARAAELEKRAAIAEERRRIMRDMHDGIGTQLISSISLAERGALPPREVADILRKCVDELRLAIDSLKPLGADLNAVLANFRYRFEPRLASAGPKLEWAVDELPCDSRLTPEAILQVMRILQEALANVIKHAGARQVSIVARYDAGADEIRLQISDDGRGFDHLLPHRGEGLASMAARAERLGARLDIVSDSQAGTEIRLRLPLHRDQSSLSTAPA